MPPWVLAGPVIARLRALLEQFKRGLDFKGIRRQRRGEPFSRATLGEDLPSYRPLAARSLPVPRPLDRPVLRGAIRWTLERVLEELGLVGGDDRVALGLRVDASRLLEQLRDVRACTRVRN